MFEKVNPAHPDKVADRIADIDSHPEYRDEIVRFVKENAGVEYAVARLNEYVSEAVDALEVLPPSLSRDYLVELAYYTANRAM